MLYLEEIYEVVAFSIDKTKTGAKMGKLQLKNLSNETVLNCILWEDVLNRIDSKIVRTGNHVKILKFHYNNKYDIYNINELELVKEAQIELM